MNQRELQQFFIDLRRDTEELIRRRLREHQVDLTNVRGVIPGRNLPTTGNTGSGYTPAAHDINGALHTGGPLTAPNGGTGQAAYTIGDLLYASAVGVLSKLAAVATGNALISGGVGAAPSWGKIGLTTHVSGILPPANGGTGVNNGSNAATFPATGTVAMRDAENTFTQEQTFDVGVLIKQSLDAGQTLVIPAGYAHTVPKRFAVSGTVRVAGLLRVE